MSIAIQPGARPLINRPALNKAAELHVRGYRWYQLFAFPRTEDQIFGGHLIVAGAIGTMVAFNIGTGITNPGNYFYLTIEPQLINLGIDTKEKVLTYALIHIITSIGLIYFGWWHYRNRILQASALTYAKAWGGHLIYIAWWCIAWVLWSTLVMQRGPKFGLSRDFTIGFTDAARAQVGFFNFDGFLVLLALALVGVGVFTWFNPPTFNRHLEDPKAQLHVNLTVFGWTGFLYSTFAWYTFPRGTDVAAGQWSDVALNLFVWNHINVSFLYIIGGVFHGAQYLWDVREDDKKNPWVVSRWVRWFDNQDRQVSITVVIFLLSFFTGFAAWGVAGVNSMVDFKLFPAEWYISWLKPYILEAIAPGLFHIWPGYQTSVSDWVLVHALVAGFFFVGIPVSRAVFFTRRSPLFDAKGITKRSFDYPCVGPAYGGTCGYSIQDQIWLALLWGVKPLSVIVWNMMGVYFGSLQYAPQDQFNGRPGMLFFIFQATSKIWNDGHLTMILYLGHLVWLLSFMFWFMYRGSRLEGAYIFSRAMKRWFNVDFVPERWVSTLVGSRMLGTYLYYSGVFICVLHLSGRRLCVATQRPNPGLGSGRAVNESPHPLSCALRTLC